MHIYVKREREREREKHLYIYIYIYEGEILSREDQEAGEKTN